MVYTKENYNISTLKWTKDEKPCVVCGKNTHALDYCFESHICSTECMKKYTDEINKTCNKSENPEVANMDIKWYIFNNDNEPLTFDGKAIEFKNMESAQAFYETTKRLVPEPEPDYFSGGEVKSAILFYDGGKVELRDLTKEQLDSMAEGFYDEYMKILRSLSHE